MNCIQIKSILILTLSLIVFQSVFGQDSMKVKKGLGNIK